MKYKEIEGDLLKLSRLGHFDVIVHGCNCFNCMGAGIAPQMAQMFGADKYPLEHDDYDGDINKLGLIDYKSFWVTEDDVIPGENKQPKDSYCVTAVNSYTQFGLAGDYSNRSSAPIDYEAVTLVMRKINNVFKGKTIGLPLIGCGLAGGVWSAVKAIIQNELRDCNIIIVHYKP